MPANKIQFVNSLDAANLGPERKVKMIAFKTISFGEPSTVIVRLECEHVFDGIKLPHKFQMRKVYRCGQCRANSNHQV